MAGFDPLLKRPSIPMSKRIIQESSSRQPLSLTFIATKLGVEIDLLQLRPLQSAEARRMAATPGQDRWKCLLCKVCLGWLPRGV